jgi:hypothetical protein
VSVTPQRPTHMPEYATVCLQALVAHGLADCISLGGAFGLMHYLDYRPTHDVDAWWSENASPREQQQVVEVLQTTLQAFGQVHIRSWGEVVSVELRQAGATVFGFQIARRSAQLEPSQSTPWIDVPLDSFADLVASKMVALVERGAPRDLRDIYMLCQERLITPADCWRLWQRRQTLAGSDADPHRAELAIQTHVARIAQYRPLDRIEDPEQRDEAKRVRAWLQGEFLDALRSL